MTPEEITAKVRVGMTREEVITALGPPDDVGGGSRKYPVPSVWKYGDVELHFINSRYDAEGRGYSWPGPLVFIYMENEDHTEGWTLLK